MTASPPKTERVGIFGGSFNPPHTAHLIVAEIIREQFELDRILWIPNRRSPFKNESELADAEHRLAMTRAATEENEAFRVSEIEIRRTGVSYTVDTVRTLQEQRPGTTYYLIIGSDSLAGFDGWREPDELLERVPLVVFPRSGFLDAAAPRGREDRVTFADAPLIEISGTELRRRVREGLSIRYMVPEEVRRYIDRHGLYR